MYEGTFFGDLALSSSSTTLKASIKMKTECFLAYLDRFDYNMVMKQVIRKNTHRQL